MHILYTRSLQLALGLFVAASAHAEAWTTATLDARTGEVLECTVGNHGDAIEEAEVSIFDAVGGALLAGGQVLAVPAGLAESVSYTVPFSGPRQAYCEVLPRRPNAPLRASLKRLSGSRQVEDSSDATVGGAGLTTTHQYVPYTVTIAPFEEDGEVCAPVSMDSDVNLVLDSDAPFTATSLLVNATVKESTDFVGLRGMRVDGFLFRVFTRNLVRILTAVHFDLLGGGFPMDPTTSNLVNVPLELSSRGDPNLGRDIVITLGCRAGPDQPVVIEGVQLHGWRRADAPVSLSFEGALP